MSCEAAVCGHQEFSSGKICQVFRQVATRICVQLPSISVIHKDLSICLEVFERKVSRR